MAFCFLECQAVASIHFPVPGYGSAGFPRSGPERSWMCKGFVNTTRNSSEDRDRTLNPNGPGDHPTGCTNLGRNSQTGSKIQDMGQVPVYPRALAAPVCDTRRRLASWTVTAGPSPMAACWTHLTGSTGDQGEVEVGLFIHQLPVCGVTTGWLNIPVLTGAHSVSGSNCHSVLCPFQLGA